MVRTIKLPEGAKVRYIVTSHGYARHETAQDALRERDRLRRRVSPDRARKFRVLTVIDEPKTASLERDAAEQDGTEG